MPFPRSPGTPVRDNRQQRSNASPGDLKKPYDKLSPVASTFWGTPVLKDANGKKYCPGYIGDTFSKNAWDYVVFAFLDTLGVSDKTPGICNVSVRRGRGVDRKKSSGSDGQTLTFTGINNADIEIAITIWTPDQLDVLMAMWKVLQPPSGKGQPSAFDVSHPQFEINGIRSVVIVDSIGMEPGPAPKSRTFTIKAIEYLPPGPKKATSTPKKAEARGSKLDTPETQQPGKNPKATGPRR